MSNAFGLNCVSLGGEVVDIDIRKPKDKTKNPTAILTLKYGVTRSQSNKEVEFVNAVYVRIPSYSYTGMKTRVEAFEWALKNPEKFEAKYGRTFSKATLVEAHLQGLLRQVGPKGVNLGDKIENEVVVDKLSFIEDWDQVWKDVLKTTEKVEKTTPVAADSAE